MKNSTSRLVSPQYILPFILVSSLFFLWGFARSILDVLNKHFQLTMDISIARSSMIQATTYLGYFLMAIPAGLFLSKFGYRRGVVAGLLLFAAGAFLFIPGEAAGSFEFFLIALFIIGSGLVMLETAANPYITELGDPSTSASRLNLAQAFNGFGCLLAPALVGQFLLSGDGGNVAIPYSVMGVVVMCVAIIFSRVKLPEINSDANIPSHDNQSPWQRYSHLLSNRRFMAGLGALFFYEIAEISINSLFINYTTSDGWLAPSTAAVVLSFGGLGLFLLARIVGSAVMSRIKAEKVLTACTLLTVISSLLVILDIPLISHYAIFGCYAFEAIIFPTIFAISVRGLGSSTKLASSLLMMTPLGGAVGTMIMGAVADSSSISTSFIVPCIAYFIVFLYSVFKTKN